MRLSRYSALISSVLILALFLVPVGAVLTRVSLNAVFLEVFFSSDTLSIVGFTLKQALLSLFFSLVVGLLLGIYFSRHWSEKIRANLLTLTSMPTLLTAMAVLLLLRGTSFRFGLVSVVLSHVLLNAPWIAAVVAEARFQFPSRLREAAKMSGAGEREVFTHHELPFIGERLAHASLQVFSLCVMSFALVLLLGGGPPVQTLETEIYARVRMGDPDFSLASVYAIWQLVLTLVPWGSWFIFRRKLGYGSFQRASTEARVVVAGVSRSSLGSKKSTRKKITDLLPILISWVLLLPYFWILFSEPAAFRTELLSGFFTDTEVWSAFFVSMEMAIGVGVLVLSLSSLVVHASSRFVWFEILGVLPAGVSALVLGLGFWFAYGSFIDPFEGSLLAMICIQAMLLVPLGVRTLLPLRDEKNRTALEAARLLGASPVRAWFDVEFPRARGPALSVFGIAAVYSLGEIAAVSLFASERVTPLPLLLSRFMGRYEFDRAALLSVFLFLVSFILLRLVLGVRVTRARV